MRRPVNKTNTGMEVASTATETVHNRLELNPLMSRPSIGTASIMSRPSIGSASIMSRPSISAASIMSRPSISTACTNISTAEIPEETTYGTGNIIN